MSQKQIKKRRREVLKQVQGDKGNVQSDRKEEVFFGDGLRDIVRRNKLFLLGLIGLVVVLYFNAMWGDFVSDDYASITQNPLLLDAKHMLGNMNLVSGSTFFLAKIFGTTSPVPYHFFSLFLYIFVCVSVFIFVYLLFDAKVAKLTSLLFAVLPIHVETVSWVSGKPYLFIALGVLMVLSLLVLFLKKGDKKYLYWFLVVTVLSFMGDNVRPLAVVFLSFLLLFSYKNRLSRELPLAKIVVWGMIFLSIAGVVFWPDIIGRIQNVNSGYNGSGEVFYNPFFQYPTAVAKYLQMLLMPTDLTLYHTLYVFPVWLNWLILLVYMFSLIYFWFKNRNLFFALAFIFVATIPSMAPVKVSWLVAERYMFLGSVGFCLFLVLAFLPLVERYKGMMIGVFLVLMVGYSARVFWRNIDWQTNHKLWINTCQVSPNSHNAWNNIGDDYDKLGDYENAVKGFTQSTVVKNNYADAYHNRANIFFKMGRLDLARDSYNITLSIAPNMYQTYMSLSQIDLNEGKRELAVAHGQKLIELQPNDPQSHYVFGVILAKVGWVDRAQEELELALRLNPNFKAARKGLESLKNIKSGS